MNDRVTRLFIDLQANILNALKQMDNEGKKILLVFDGFKFSSVLSIGDIQRAIIRGVPFESPIRSILRSNTRIATINNSFDEIKTLMLQFRMELCPVVNDVGELVNVYFWDDIFDTTDRVIRKFNIPVVIMAGGLGTRMQPLTNVLPKPLIPLYDKTFIEEIFQRFHIHGCNTFYISVNYKAELIEYYLEQQKLPYELNYFKENKPMGTAGSLSLLRNKLKETFFVSNCDILIDQDYSEVLDYHIENKNEITIVAALKHIPIPYGIIETDEDGNLINLLEKPELSYKINSGMYILEPHLLAEIPENVFSHITQLIDAVKKRNGRVGVFPVTEKSWIDIGDWGEYVKNQISRK